MSMKMPLLIGFFSINVILACQVNKPEWRIVEINALENFPSIDSSRWSYPWYMALYEGGFENILSDTILSQDTVHLIYNSTCVTNTWPDTLPFCRATLNNDTLELEIYEKGPAGSVALVIKTVEGKFKCQYESFSPVPNTEYTERQFEKQKLVLNTDHWKKGTIIKGKVHVRWKRTFQDRKSKKESIKGNFEAIIE